MKKLVSSGRQADTPHSDLDALLHPARAFARPSDVVSDPDLTRNEKRAILASWASDACAVEATPALRCAPGSEGPVSVDAILEALRDLDRASADGAAWLRRPTRRRTIEALRSRRVRAGGDPASGLPH